MQAMWAALALAIMIVPVAAGQYQPFDPSFHGMAMREDVTQAGSLEGAQRVLRFVHVTDAHILDDDAPYPLRQEPLDALGSPFTSAARPQDEYTDEVLASLIHAINALHDEDALDFVINTGDNIDNQLENELMRFVDLWEGTTTTTGPFSGLVCVPDGQSRDVEDASQDSADLCTHVPEIPGRAALAEDLPWLAAFGNHDGLIQGNVPANQQFQDAADQWGRYFLDHDEYVALHFASGASCMEGTPLGSEADDMGHGFGHAMERLCDEDPDNDGYYAFDHAGVRFVVLDTLNDDFVTGNDNLAGLFRPEMVLGSDYLGGYSEGAIDPVQFAWLQDTLHDSQDRLVVLMAHHTVNSMLYSDPSGTCGPPGCLADLVRDSGYATGEQLDALIGLYPNAVAFFGGHTHRHNVEAKGQGTYWNIETSSLIDSPQEARIVELWTTDNGTKGFWTLTAFTHGFETSRALADGDPQRDPDAAGDLDDRTAMLWFDIPPNVDIEVQPIRLETLEIALLQPAVDVIVQPDAPVDVVVQVLREGPRRGPVDGLDVTWRVVHQPPGASTRTVDVEGPLEAIGNGSYASTFTPAEAATYYVTITAADPTGLHAMETRLLSLPVGSQDAPRVQSEAPGPPIVVVMALALLAGTLARRR